MSSLCGSIWAYFRRSENAEAFVDVAASIETTCVADAGLSWKEKDRLLPANRKTESSRCCCTLI
eukprot:m.247894 g.247894  ORF g.247894 m.247894 type:complete len:64 (+) comp40277_c0_seq3:425-616(+)